MSGKPPPDEVLSIEDVHITVHDGAATAVRGITLSVGAGEIVGLVGESGSGKTLACRAALGVLPAGCAVSRGTISFGGENVTDLSRRGWERLHGTAVGAVFQDPSSYLNPSLTVGSQLTEDDVTAIADELASESDPNSKEAIEHAIGAVTTHQQPNDADVARVRSRLAAGGWPLAKPSLEHWPNP